MNRILKKTCIGLAAGLVALAVLAALALWLVPTRMLTPVAQRYLARHDKELLGRHVTVGDLYLNPYKGDFAVHRLKIAEADDTTRFFGFNELSGQIRPGALLKKQIHLTRLYLDALDLTVVQNGESFNFDDMVHHFAADTLQAEDAPGSLPDTARTTEGKSPWRILLQDMSINQSRLAYIDSLLGSRWDLENITLHIPEIDLSHVNPDVGLELEFADGGTLQLSGAYKTSEQQYTADVTLQHFPLSHIKPYLQKAVNVSEVAGRLKVALHVEGSTADLMDCTVSGRADIVQLALTTPSEEPVMSLDTVGIVLQSLQPLRQTVTLDDIYIGGFTFPYELMADSTTNIDRWLVSTPDESPEKTPADAVADTAAPKDWQLTVNRFSFENGRVNYIDHTLAETFRTSARDIAITAEDIHPETQNAVSFGMRIDRNGLLQGSWIGNIQDMSNMQLNARLTNLDLTMFSPYALAMFGNRLSAGQLSFKTTNTITNNQLLGENRLDIFAAEVGGKEPGTEPAYNIPLKTALYLLTDLRGNIGMDLPVKGDISSPTFSYRKILWRTFLNVLIKAVTSPAAILSNTIGLSGDQFNPAPLAPMQDTLTARQYRIVDRWAGILRQKPDLCLYITQKVNYNAYVASLRENGTDASDIPTPDAVHALMQRRDQQLRTYLSEKLQLQPSQFSCTFYPLDSLGTYAGDDLLEVNVLMQE